jgi:putative hydrolase of the HAD superfamily
MSIVEETPQVPFQVRGDFGDPGHHAPAIRDIFGPRCFQLYPDIRPVLSALKTNGFRLAVIANRHRGLDFFCFEMNLLAFLDAVISSADIGIEKPDSRIFNEAERRLNVKPERIVHIGDLKDDDFRGALAAAFKGSLIDRSGQNPTHLNRIENLFGLELQLQMLV